MNKELAEVRGLFGINELNFHPNFLRRCFFVLLAAIAFTTFSNSPAIAAGKIVNVKAAPFFAKGDGITDDSAAIQAAVNAAGVTPGNIVLFPSGNYLHNTAIDVNGVQTSLKGLNRGNTIISGAGFNLNADGVQFFGLNIKSPTSVIESVSNKAKFSSCNFDTFLNLRTCSDVQISNCDFNFTAGGQLYLNYANRVSVTASRLKGNVQFYSAIVTLYSTDLSFKQLEIITTQGVGINSYGNNRVLVERCNIRDVSAGLYNYVSQYSTNVTFRNNVIGFATQDPNINAIYSSNENNVLFSNNQIQRAFMGVRVYSGAAIAISGNQISKTLSNGIYLQSEAGKQIVVEKNTIRDCGLDSATAAILARNLSGDFTAIIQNNTYTGNQQNIRFFIRCEPPSPPCVVQGNRTNTLLPTQVGP